MAIALPIPLDAPVTSTVLSSKSIGHHDVSSGHADTAKTAELAGKIEQDFVAARPADEGQAGGTACYGADRQAYLRKAGNAGRARQAHGPYAEVLERLPRSGDKRSN